MSGMIFMWLSGFVADYVFHRVINRSNGGVNVDILGDERRGGSR